MPTECPRCNSYNIDAYDTTFQENDSISTFVKCDECDFQWTEFYECVGWTVSGEIFEQTQDERVFKPDEKYTEVKQ